MGKAKVNQLAVGVASLHYKSGQVIKNDRQVDVRFEHGRFDHLQPDALQVGIQRIQGAA